jgi:hypothetical protein
MDELDANVVLNAKVSIANWVLSPGSIELATCAKHYWRIPQMM